MGRGGVVEEEEDGRRADITMREGDRRKRQRMEAMDILASWPTI